jgi:hypothetical protein
MNRIFNFNCPQTPRNLSDPNTDPRSEIRFKKMRNSACLIITVVHEPFRS